MNRVTKYLLSGALMTSLAMPAVLTKFARGEDRQPAPQDQQDRPPAPDGDPNGGPNGGPPPTGDDQNHPGPRGHGGQQRPGDNRAGDNRPGPRPGGMAGEMNPFDRMRGYLDLVDRFSRLARDPVASGVAAVVAAGDILRPRGADAAIDFYTKSLATVKSDAVKRAIQIQLVDLYRQSGQNEKALEHLTQLMNDAPAGDAPPSITPR